MSKYCKICGAANSDVAKVCTRCGNMLPHEGGKTVQREQKTSSERINKLMSQKKTKYGIGIAVLCVVIIVIFVSMSNKGIVGTWESDEYFSERCNVRSIITFNKDNTAYGYVRPDYDEIGTSYWRWEEVEGEKYRIIDNDTNSSIEVSIESGNKEFVLGGIVYHRK